MKQTNCEHYKGEGYQYKISDNETLNLCDQCNLNLAGELMKQMVIEIFSDTMLKN